MTKKSLKVETFSKTSDALKFIDQLEKKNKRCLGKLNCFPTEEEGKYLWHVTYDPAWLEKEVKSTKQHKVIEGKITKPKTAKVKTVKAKSKIKSARANRK